MSKRDVADAAADAELVAFTVMMSIVCSGGKVW